MEIDRGVPDAASMAYYGDRKLGKRIDQLEAELRELREEFTQLRNEMRRRLPEP